MHQRRASQAGGSIEGAYNVTELYSRVSFYADWIRTTMESN